ncbi:hypothetical protein [Thermococcus sp. 2319x1]|uniref:hypothetical protein n=1 Tax=Thermococcus sp. 2319x1 TaxID=1674923 RepID=UPI00073D3270|nr:hypothetical protein [Thermococcus sp. 2319x1]
MRRGTHVVVLFWLGFLAEVMNDVVLELTRFLCDQMHEKLWKPRTFEYQDLGMPIDNLYFEGVEVG